MWVDMFGIPQCTKEEEEDGLFPKKPGGRRLKCGWICLESPWCMKGEEKEEGLFSKKPSRRRLKCGGHVWNPLSARKKKKKMDCFPRNQVGGG